MTRTAMGRAPAAFAASLLPVLTAAWLAGCGAQELVPAGPPLTVAAAGGSHPTAALDPRTGRGFVSWVGDDGGGEYDVYLAVAEPGADRFGEPVRVNAVAGETAPHDQAPPQVAVGPEGNVYVVWQTHVPVPGRRFPASDLRLAVSTDDGRSFAPAIFVNDDAGGLPSSHTFHDVAVGADGTVHVSWIDSRERDRAAAALPGGDEGHDTELPGAEIRVARSMDGGRGFGPSVVVDAGSCPCCRTALAIGLDGSVYVAWRKIFDGDIRDIVVARAAPGADAFDAPVPVHRDGWVFPGCPHAGPGLAVDDAGRVHVAWYTGEEGRQGLWYAVSDDGARSFSAPEPLVTGEWVPPSLAHLAVAGDGVWAVWEDRRGEPGEVLAARWRVGDRPSPIRPAAADHGRTPAVAVAGAAALLAWVQGESVMARWVGGGRGTP